MSRSRYRRSLARQLIGSNSSSLLPWIGTVLMGLVGYVGCNPDGSLRLEAPPAEIVRDLAFPSASGSTSRYVNADATHRGLPVRAQETVLIASFNIQAFGETKGNDRWVMERLAEVIRRFDIVAIQEIRSRDQQLLPNLMSYVNARGDRYDFILGPRLGDTVSKEQYAYVFNSDRILANPQSYTLNDDINLLHREPLVARFIARTNRTNQPWTFSLVNLHTDPDVAVRELDSMGGIMREIRNYEWGSAYEDDVILLGDMNAGPEKMTKLQQLAGLVPIIAGESTNVRETALYDNLLLDPNSTVEFTGNRGVLKLREFFGISMDDALKLSDHNPIWAEFFVEEHASPSSSQYAAQSVVGYR